jgi:hypothetical protein
VGGQERVAAIAVGNGLASKAVVDQMIDCFEARARLLRND